MQIDPLRVAKWRKRAADYRVCAGATASAGAQLAYVALADAADSVADRLEQGALPSREPSAFCRETKLVRATATDKTADHSPANTR